jgi:hypothetical protein
LDDGDEWFKRALGSTSLGGMPLGTSNSRSSFKTDAQEYQRIANRIEGKVEEILGVP